MVETPKSLTEDQRLLLEELAESLEDEGPAADSEDKSWFEKFKDTIGSPE